MFWTHFLDTFFDHWKPDFTVGLDKTVVPKVCTTNLEKLVFWTHFLTVGGQISPWGMEKTMVTKHCTKNLENNFLDTFFGHWKPDFTPDLEKTTVTAPCASGKGPSDDTFRRPRRPLAVLFAIRSL